MAIKIYEKLGIKYVGDIVKLNISENILNSKKERITEFAPFLVKDAKKELEAWKELQVLKGELMGDL